MAYFYICGQGWLLDKRYGRIVDSTGIFSKVMPILLSSLQLPQNTCTINYSTIPLIQKPSLSTYRYKYAIIK